MKNSGGAGRKALSDRDGKRLEKLDSTLILIFVSHRKMRISSQNDK
jgi:hypothetical protein